MKYRLLKTAKAIFKSIKSTLKESVCYHCLKRHLPLVMLKHELLRNKKYHVGIFFILIDNFRLDQWRLMQEIIADLFIVEEDDTYYSILPTATSYARNSIFSGLTPLDMSKQHPDIWVNDEGDNEEGLNKNEEEFLKRQLKRKCLV